jgi:hypothetical protein
LGFAIVSQRIVIPPLVLDWSEWVAWNDLLLDARRPGVVKVPNRRPGVYEARYSGDERRLTIGKATDHRMRVKQGLVKGKTPHSAGRNIRASEDTSKIVVRWAVVDRPACVEEELHRLHRERFGGLPKHTEHT